MKCSAREVSGTSVEGLVDRRWLLAVTCGLVSALQMHLTIPAGWMVDGVGGACLLLSRNAKVVASDHVTPVRRAHSLTAIHSRCREFPLDRWMESSAHMHRSRTSKISMHPTTSGVMDRRLVAMMRSSDQIRGHNCINLGPGTCSCLQEQCCQFCHGILGPPTSSSSLF
jgi:hypothetical protein